MLLCRACQIAKILAIIVTYLTSVSPKKHPARLGRYGQALHQVTQAILPNDIGLQGQH